MEVATLKRARETAFDLQAGTAERRAVAAFLGLADVRELRFRGQIAPMGREDWQMTGRLTADLDQICVATLEPLPMRVDLAVVDRRGMVELIENILV